jgi:pre-mRNA-splicing factor SPF27
MSWKVPQNITTISPPSKNTTISSRRLLILSNMSLTSAIHDSLPYIDAEPTTQQRLAAQTLIDLELQTTGSDTTTHPRLPPLLPSNLSPLILLEHERILSKEPLKAIDTKRYEELDAPETDSKDAANLAAWNESLRKAYTSHTYLSSRLANLALLESYGKNSWLISNSQLEDVLRGLEKELATAKSEIDDVVIARKTAQEAVGPEIKGLEEGWKKGVGRVLEVEVAGEAVRRDILERRWNGAR